MKTRTVLIIDDQPEEAEPLIVRLRQEGYRVLFATAGQTGLQVASTERPEVILCDLEMPGLGGYDVMEAIAANPQTRELPFILMNAEWNNGPGGNWSLQRNGRTPSCHFTKPYNVCEVARYLGRIYSALNFDRSDTGNEASQKPGS